MQKLLLDLEAAGVASTHINQIKNSKVIEGFGIKNYNPNIGGDIDCTGTSTGAYGINLVPVD